MNAKSNYWFLGIWICALPLGCSHQQQPPAVKPTVTADAAPPPKTPQPAHDNEGVGAPPAPRASQPATVFFDFDSALLQEDARNALAKAALDIKQRNAGQVAVEGNCDERGTVEYNLALGQQRAEAAKQYLVHMGVPAQRIKTVSFGSQRPRYPGHDETAHARNRRDDIIYR